MIKEAMLYTKLEDGSLRCGLCAHRCRIEEGQFGICGVRQNQNGILYTLVYGEVIAEHIDPIEKKPLYHFLPGSRTYSIATIGCNFTCEYCQNWQIAQLSKRSGNSAFAKELSPEEIVEKALKNGCKSISYTYTEPTIFFEYAFETAKIAKKHNLYNIFVTNGFMSKEAIDLISPYLDGANIDLKSFNDNFYKKTCHGRLEPVLDTVSYMKKLGIWIEVTTLLIPGENDSEDELLDIAAFIGSIDMNIPWHISRFHPDYQYMDHEATPIVRLREAARIGKEAGLKSVYLGNVIEGNDTICADCSEIVIARSPFSINQQTLINGICPKCGSTIAGVWK